MKAIAQQISFLLIFILLGCNKNIEPEPKPEMPPDKIEDCSFGTFYLNMILNGKCWEGEDIKFYKEIESFLVVAELKNKFDEAFIFNFPLNTLIGESHFFFPWVFNSKDSIATPNFFFNEGDGTLISYDIPQIDTTGTNYFIIDNMNQDSTLMEGRFECTLIRDGETNAFDAPDSLVITDGMFRLEREN